MSDQYWNQLVSKGDPIEKEGAVQWGLAFPRYAEFWAKRVFPYRDPEEPGKFRRGFPIALEDLCNTHYYVWYHLTIVYRQLSQLDRGLVDISDPFYHLASAIDLIEQVCVMASVLNGGFDVETQRFSEGKYQEQVTGFWESYSDAFESFRNRYIPVTIPLHNITMLFNRSIPDSDARGDFNRIQGTIRKYRNIFTHRLTPLREMRDGIVCIPDSVHLDKYKYNRWSADRDKLNPEHYAPAEQVIRGLTDNLIRCTDALWVLLLQMADAIYARELPQSEITVAFDDNVLYLDQVEGSGSPSPSAGTIDYAIYKKSHPEDPSAYKNARKINPDEPGWDDWDL